MVCKRVKYAPAALALLCLLALPASGTAQDDQVGAYRIRTDSGEEVRLDGLLSEDLWSRAVALSGFRQREPDQGAAATEQTEVRIAYDDAMLYIGVLAYDSEPDEIVARILQRDKLIEPLFFGTGIQFAGDDAIAIMLDPFHDHRSGVIFATNPNGAEFEALVSDEGTELNIDWRGVWEVRSSRTSEGWSAEFAIPWRTLRYPEASGDELWGINVFRVIRRKNEETLWQSWQREGGGFHRVSRAGHLTGLSDLPQQGLNLEMKPFVLAGRRQEANEAGAISSSVQREIGLDIKTELRPGLVLDLTLNTDFAQVEVDDAQVNLTRFSLFFPEKRDFFLENSGIFDFGVLGDPMMPPPYQMFFSRNIGISDDGEVPILAGARLTGRVGGQTIGLLNVVTEEAFGVPRENFSVARIKRDIGESNYVGAMVVDRRSSQGWNTTAGIDGQFVIGEAWVWDAYVAQSLTDRGDVYGYSYNLGYFYEGESWTSFFNHYAISPNADAGSGSGFVARSDLRSTTLYAGPKWRPSWLGIRDISMFVGGSYSTTVSDGRLQDYAGGVGVGPVWESGDQVTAFFNASETVVDERFELSDGVIVPAGRYRADHVGWFAFSSSSRAFVVGSTAMVSQFYDGTLVSLGGTLNLAPSPQISFTAGYTRNQVDVTDGSFNADISSLRATYSYSTKLSTNVLVQYTSLEKACSTNVRFTFIHRPGSDFFVVFTENRGDDRRVWNLSDRGMVMKITYLARM